MSITKAFKHKSHKNYNKSGAPRGCRSYCILRIVKQFQLCIVCNELYKLDKITCFVLAIFITRMIDNYLTIEYNNIVKTLTNAAKQKPFYNPKGANKHGKANRNRGKARE